MEERKMVISLPKRAQKAAEVSYEDDNPSHDSGNQIFKEDYTSLKLKSDSINRPLWICHDGRIILEAFSPMIVQAQDFLITIAEPVTRPARIHEYKLTAYSLYAAVSVGMSTSIILDVLERFSKSALPDSIVKFIKDCTLSYGKVKLVLKQNKYNIESAYPEILQLLLHDPIIAAARVITKYTPNDSFGIAKLATSKIQDDAFGAVITLDREDDEDDVRNSFLEKNRVVKEEEQTAAFTTSFAILTSMVEDVKKRCIELDFPLMEEYDFRHDDLSPNLSIDLSPKTVIRDYQEKSLSKMFGGGTSGGRARSGIIVLPTGAGKTLVGITAACTVKKSTIILCTNAISVAQWSKEFRRWSTIPQEQIAKFTADSKQRFPGKAGVLISTYTMISHTGKRAYDTQKMLEFVNGHDWGLMILDEVHVVPANVFRRVLTTVAAHTKLGLTATLVREDDKIEDLNFLIGPKLYEANWMDLANRGHIAQVEATEVWCPMPGDFYNEYTKSKPGKRRLLCVMNPAKFMATQHLIQWRESLGDKIIVFSDNVFALQHYAVLLKKPFIYGATSHEERSRILNHFRAGHEMFRTIFLSKVGDTSLDLPEATCLIQISSQFGSRRQEAQRMGRILRAKRRNEEGFKSRFYTLVCRDTDEVMFSAKRRSFLVDQGYEFNVISNFVQLIPGGDTSNLHYSQPIDQARMLDLVKSQTEATCDDEIIEADPDDLAGVWQQNQLQKQKNAALRKSGNGPVSAAVVKVEKKTHKLFKKFRK